MCILERGEETEQELEQVHLGSFPEESPSHCALESPLPRVPDCLPKSHVPPQSPNQAGVSSLGHSSRSYALLSCATGQDLSQIGKGHRRHAETVTQGCHSCKAIQPGDSGPPRCLTSPRTERRRSLGPGRQGGKKEEVGGREIGGGK